ncbi:unnamed protein product [Notodromas monacha]|uniref:p53 DNA-binding domain-containing protein n=1 Tax=Notodromas monacha TaxID=399045 RepID=A0A7R9G9Z4_9CRUS|nr:unnamed protein product [Notodromas monacha]CAG0914812.1 unnamed protein product [Notodromas monacha]
MELRLGSEMNSLCENEGYPPWDPGDSACSVSATKPDSGKTFLINGDSRADQDELPAWNGPIPRYVDDMDTHLELLNEVVEKHTYVRNTSAATAHNVNMSDFAGSLEFCASITNPEEEKSTPSSGSAVWSTETRKLYVKMGYGCRVYLSYSKTINRLRVRIVPVFLDVNSCETRVAARCSKHRDPDHKSNENHPSPEHVVMVTEDPNWPVTYRCTGSELSVLCELGSILTKPLKHLDVHFMCLSSCEFDNVRKRKSKLFGIIFFLEDERGVILGKSTLRVRVCSCPVRDMKNEEADSSGTSQQSIKRASTDCGGGAESKQFRANEGRPFYLDGLDAEVAYKLSRLLPVPCDENDVGSRNFLYPDS